MQDEVKKIIGNRIRDLRIKNGYEQSEVAEKLNYKSDTTISKWESGSSLPTGKKLVGLALLFNTSTDYILFGIEPKNETPPTQPPSELVTAITDKVVQLTTPRQENVLDYATDQLERQQKEESIIEEDNIIYFPYDYYDHPVSAGTGQYLSDVDVETIELPIEVNADFVVPVQGVSMEPDYHDGDHAFIKLTYNLSDGDIGVFYYNGDAYIKQLRIDGKKAYLHSLNPAYPDMPITENVDFRIIGEVVDVYREG